MTTKDKGVTLPSWSYLRLVNACLEVSNSLDFSSDLTYKYTHKGIYPVNTNAVSFGTIPSSLYLQAQNANPTFAYQGADVNVVPGIGSLGEPSGNLVVKNSSGAGGAYNTSHIQLGSRHLWFDSANRLRWKSSQPVADMDGSVVNIELSAQVAYDPPSLAKDTGVTTTVIVTGAILGDFSLVSFSADLLDVVVTSYVSAANTVSVRFQNQTGATVDIPSGILRVRVIKQ